MPATFDSIATTTLSSPATNITFSSITSAYTDLKLFVFVRSDRASSVDSMYMQWNGDTSTNYSDGYLYADGGGSTASGRGTNQNQILCGSIPGATATSGFFSSIIVDLMNYSASAAIKTCLINTAYDSNGGGRTQIGIGIRRVAEAITSIKLFPAFGTNFETGTTAALYGILKA
jgi:hypothetical protein